MLQLKKRGTQISNATGLVIETGEVVIKELHGIVTDYHNIESAVRTATFDTRIALRKAEVIAELASEITTAELDDTAKATLKASLIKK